MLSRVPWLAISCGGSDDGDYDTAQLCRACGLAGWEEWVLLVVKAYGVDDAVDVWVNIYDTLCIQALR